MCQVSFEYHPDWRVYDLKESYNRDNYILSWIKHKGYSQDPDTPDNTREQGSWSGIWRKVTSAANNEGIHTKVDTPQELTPPE